MKYIDRTIYNFLIISFGIFSISWFKDGQPYPWQNFGSSLPILFAKNQSLVIVSMTPQDEGKYKCMAMDEKEEVRNKFSI